MCITITDMSKLLHPIWIQTQFVKYHYCWLSPTRYWRYIYSWNIHSAPRPLQHPCMTLAVQIRNPEHVTIQPYLISHAIDGATTTHLWLVVLTKDTPAPRAAPGSWRGYKIQNGTPSGHSTSLWKRFTYLLSLVSYLAYVPMPGVDGGRHMQVYFVRVQRLTSSSSFVSWVAKLSWVTDWSIIRGLWDNIKQWKSLIRRQISNHSSILTRAFVQAWDSMTVLLPKQNDEINFDWPYVDVPALAHLSSTGPRRISFAFLLMHLSGSMPQRCAH